MLGGLYGDLPSIGGDKGEEQKKASVPHSWANSKIAPIIRKPAFAPPPSVLRAQSGVPAVRPKAPAPAVANRSSASPAAASRWTSNDPASDAVPEETFYSAPAPPQPALVGASAAVIEEYDPARPNDYDDFCRERRRKKLEEEVRRDLERRRQEEEEREKELIRQRELALQKSREMEANPSASGERTSALGISGEEAWRRRAALSAGGAGRAMPEASPKLARSPSPPPTGLGLGARPGGLMIGPGGTMSAAERMMAKMGWKEGEGLGKDRQGMTTPLMARKIDKRAGVIVNASAKKVEEPSSTPAAGMMPPPPAKPKAGVPVIGPPTRVLLLRNMVGRGEVDGELEEEVKEECTKYGSVTQVLIFEITDPNFPVTEAVRIFIQFDRPESAMKALVDLDGRFFGGRVVRASFYDESKYSANQLEPQLGEIPADTGTEG